jgi:multiple sugar transport system substrate-binding protein
MKRFPGQCCVVALGAVLPWLAGCGTSGGKAKPAAPPFSGVAIRIAAVGDPSVLPAVTAQRGEWQASRGGECSVVPEPVEPADAAGAHVLVFPADRLGELVDAGALAVLPESVVRPPAPAPGAETGGGLPGEQASQPSAADELQFADVLPAYREQVSKYSSDREALPLGGSALVLVINRTAFERPDNRAAAAAGAAKLTLEPPTTWLQLDALARFFHGRDWNGDGTNDSGIALALGPDPEGVGDAIFLARAASLGQHRDHYSLLFDSETMAPRIASPPFVEALQGLVALEASGPPGVAGFDAEAARAAFREGKVALLIDRAEKAARWGGSGAKSIDVAPLPGSERVYEPARKTWEPLKVPNRPSYLPAGGGWLVGVSASAGGREREAAIDFARYLVNPETSSRVRSDPAFPVLPVRSAQVGQGLPDPRLAPGVNARSWSEAVGRTLAAERVVPGLRIPGTRNYLADLAKGRAAAARGEPADTALRGVAVAWTARTKALGTARQTWHYRRSLNALATSPKPPARDGG